MSIDLYVYIMDCYAFICLWMHMSIDSSIHMQQIHMSSDLHVYPFNVYIIDCYAFIRLWIHMPIDSSIRMQQIHMSSDVHVHPFICLFHRFLYLMSIHVYVHWLADSHATDSCVYRFTRSSICKSILSIAISSHVYKCVSDSYVNRFTCLQHIDPHATDVNVLQPYKREYILQKRPIILRSLLIVATPWHRFHMSTDLHVCSTLICLHTDSHATDYSHATDSYVYRFTRVSIHKSTSYIAMSWCLHMSSDLYVYKFIDSDVVDLWVYRFTCLSHIYLHVTHSYVYRIFWLSGVAVISRLLKIIGRLCKKAL